MSGASKVRSMNVADSESRAILGPSVNKAQRSSNVRKTVSKPSRKMEKSLDEVDLAEEKRVLESESSAAFSSPPPHSNGLPSILHRQGSLIHSNLALSASCSSDASSDSFHSRASTGRIYRTRSIPSRRKQSVSKMKMLAPDHGSDSSPDGLQVIKRCGWVTTNSDPSYVKFHDEEWGVPVHDDKEVFADFDPTAVAKLNEKRLIAPGSISSSLLSEIKLRSILENARQVSKVIDEFGSFDKYVWGFVNRMPIVSRFRYPRQVPVKTPKADIISKDMVRRGFRGVGPTVVYSFMQVVGITNDHLVSCFRFHDCITAWEPEDGDTNSAKAERGEVNRFLELEMCRTIDNLSFSSE